MERHSGLMAFLGIISLVGLDRESHHRALRLHEEKHAEGEPLKEAVA